MKHVKIAIIGAGDVGTSTAYALMWKQLAAEIILVDIDEKRCRGEIFDLTDAMPFCATSALKTGPFSDAGSADIIIICAGARQKPGQSRLELLDTNWNIIHSILKNMQPIQKSAIIIMVTNPVDIMAYCAQLHSGLPHNQVFGTGTYLDTQRLIGIIAHELDVSPCSVHAYMLGEHGDTQFAAWSCARIDGIPLEQMLPSQKLQQIHDTAIKRVYEIIECKKATFYGIAACVADICECIIFNQKRVLPLSTYQEKYDISFSLPTVIGEKGIERILDIPLNTHEKQSLTLSAKTLQKVIRECTHPVRAEG